MIVLDSIVCNRISNRTKDVYIVVGLAGSAQDNTCLVTQFDKILLFFCISNNFPHRPRVTKRCCLLECITISRNRRNLPIPKFEAIKRFQEEYGRQGVPKLSCSYTKLPNIITSDWNLYFRLYFYVYDLMSFGAWLMTIYHTCMKQYLSLRRWSDMIFRFVSYVWLNLS